MPPDNTLAHRLARVEDIPTALLLIRDFYAEEHLVFDEEVARRALHELVTHPQIGSLLLFELSGAVVGYAVLTFGFSLEFHGRYALLDELYLVPRVRGRGWSRYCLNIAASTSRAHGVAALRLEVSQVNSHARAIYLKVGFHDNHRHLFTQWLQPDTAP